MARITDFPEYKNSANLQLCLTLIENIYRDLQYGDNDLVEIQLKEILETFDYLENITQEQQALKTHDTEKNVLGANDSIATVLPFPARQ